MKIYVIVITYNGAKWIDKCFSSLCESSIPVNILAIDNNSSDNTVSQIKTQFPQVEIIETEANLGFGKANNIGLRKALDENADYVFLLNQDAWIEKDTIEKLVNIAEQKKEYGILSPFHLNYEGSETEKYFQEWVLTYYSPNLLNDKKENKLKPIYPSTFVHAACWLMPIETVRLVGGFDPLFFHYGEDNDYVQRLLFKNKLIGIAPKAVVHHNGLNEGLIEPQKNLNFLMIQIVMKLKNPKASNLGALTLFFKQLIQALLKSRENNISYRAYKANFWRLSKIIKSRKIQKSNLAYLK
jgi:GT2 family glycosyltransferase